MPVLSVADLKDLAKYVHAVTEVELALQRCSLVTRAE